VRSVLIVDYLGKKTDYLGGTSYFFRHTEI